MKLVICEKPKVAEKMAYALGRGKAERKRESDVSYFEVERNGEEIIVVSAVGHLYTLRQIKGEGGYPAYDIEWAPTYEVEKGADYSKKYLDAIKKLSPGADEFICACDFDVEGSLIGYNVIRFACGKGTESRMKFSSLTNEDLEAAFDGRGKLDIKNALAGEARHMLDWFYGINLSRALMASIRSAGASHSQIMSIGRVQGPALAILAKKEKSISAFVSQPYWEVKCHAKGVLFENTKGRFGKKEDAKAALAASAPNGKVAKVEKKEAQTVPQPPFDLTSLQVEAYRLFNFKPAYTLELAQSLYEGSLISYPRTSSQKLSLKLNLKKIIESLSKNPAYEKNAKLLLSQGKTVPFEGKKEDPAHPAIHPTGQSSQMNEKEGKLYDLIVKRFLSCFAENARRESQKVEVVSGTESYAASGTRTVYPGWFDFYAPYVKLEEVQLPPFSQDEEVALSGFGIDEKKTQPPKRYTPASIISELERLGLGTKATRATVVETLFKRGYVEGTSITTTEFGMAVFELLSKIAPEIMDEELTHTIEEEMEKIQDGENEKKAIEDGKRVLEIILKKFDGKEKEIGFGLLSGLKRKDYSDSLLGKCAKCGGELRSIRSRMGKQFVGCSNYPKCNATYPLPQNAKIEALGKPCEKCGTPFIRVVRRGKKTFEMCIDPACETKKGWARPMQRAVLPAKQAAPVEKIETPQAKQQEVLAPSATGLAAAPAKKKKPAVKKIMKKKTSAKKVK